MHCSYDIAAATSQNSSMCVTVEIFMFLTISTALVLQGVTSSRRVPTKKPESCDSARGVAPLKSQERRLRVSLQRAEVLSTT